MTEYYCPNCGKLVRTKNFPCNGSYACNIACLLKVTSPASNVTEKKDKPTVSYKKVARKPSVSGSSETRDNVETKEN